MLYCCVRVASLGEVYSECGGAATVAFVAVLGSYASAPADKQVTGFTVRQRFVLATKLNRHVFSRALTKLEDAGYLSRHQKDGRKPVLKLSDRGKAGLSDARKSHFRRSSTESST